MEKLKVVVLGEKIQGATWLKYLIDSNKFDIVAGVPRHTKKNIWWESEFFEDILKANKIPTVRRQELYSIDYDIIWSLMYGFVIEPELIKKAKIGINLHESPLPKYRGCNGYSHVILDNEPQYGTTLHVLGEELDSGGIIDQELFPIKENETSKELYLRTQQLSNILFNNNIDKIAHFDFTIDKIDVSKETIRKRDSLRELKEIKEDNFCDIEYIYKVTRAFDFTPFEPAYVNYLNKRYYLYVNNSYGRYDIKPNCVEFYGDIRQHLKTLQEHINITYKARNINIIIMEGKAYEQRYPLFKPVYSWE